LESTDNPQERITLLTTQLKLAEKVFQCSERKFEAGIGVGLTDVLRAKILCLDIRIQLVKEKNATHFQLLKKQ
jgi:outer membrane protein TolC